MAEDKRIRVSADTTPLQQIRQAAKELWEDLTAMESTFKQYNDGVLQQIRQQIDLLKERNSLFTAFDSNLQPIPPEIAKKRDIGTYDTNTERQGRKEPEPEIIESPLRPQRVENSPTEVERVVLPTTANPEFVERSELPVSPGEGERTVEVSPTESPRLNIDDHIPERQLAVLEQILAATNRIGDTIEQGQRNETNGVLPTSPEGGELPAPITPEGRNVPRPSSVSPSSGGGGFKMPSSISGLMSMLPYGAALFGIGQMLGKQSQYSAMQYGASDQFQRENNVLKHWLLNTVSFGMTGARASEKEVALNAARNNDRVVNEYATLRGTSYTGALREQYKANFGEDFYTNEKLATAGGSIPTAQGVAGVNSANVVGALRNQTPNPNVTVPTISVVNPAYNRKVEGQAEYRGDIANTLGLSMTQYFEKIIPLLRAGVKGSNTTDDDMMQLLLAQRIRGVSSSEQENVLRTTRFRRNEEGLTGAGVIQAFDTNLQKRYGGRPDENQLISSTLGEYLGSFNRIADRVLEKVGSINSTGIVSSMTSIQNATGLEGKQLQRVQGALMGADVAQDDVTQALLLRTAREIDPEGNLSDLQALIEDMPNNDKLQAQFFDRIKQMTGGGEAMRHTLKAIFPNLSYSDIKAADLENKTGAEVFGQGTKQGGAYSSANAQSKVSTLERSTAGTANRQTTDAYETQTLKEYGGLKAVLESIEKPIPVMIDSEMPQRTLDKLTELYDIVKAFPTEFKKALSNMNIQLE